jgi:hypothetical protein
MDPKNAQIDPFAIFQHADGFFRALDQLHQTSTSQRAGQIALPLVVLSAFASELFFKCLLCIETGKTPPIHLLFDLFKKLNPETQKVLEKHWNQIAAQRKEILDRIDVSRGLTPRDLRSNLASGSDGFRLLRYIYEGKQKPFLFGLSDLPIALRNTIAEIRPDWFAQTPPIVSQPHPVFIKSEDNPRNFWVSRKVVIDNKATTFQWAARWSPNPDDGSPG